MQTVNVPTAKAERIAASLDGDNPTAELAKVVVELCRAVEALKRNVEEGPRLV